MTSPITLASVTNPDGSVDLSRLAELVEVANGALVALNQLLDLAENHGPFGGELYHDRLERVLGRSHAALTRATAFVAAATDEGERPPSETAAILWSNGCAVETAIFAARMLEQSGFQIVKRPTEDAFAAPFAAGWNACRRSIYAVCEDVQNEADRLQTTSKPGTASEEQHAKGYYAGTRYAAKSIARGFNAMEAMDDDNLQAVIRQASRPPAFPFEPTAEDLAKPFDPDEGRDS